MNRIGICLAPLVLMLAACADDRGEYPSLARRPAEQMSPPEASAQPAPTPVTASAEPAARLAGLVEQARLAHERFSARRGRADQLAQAARGAKPGSEGWALASVALADLESARSDAMIALADLDQIYAAARIDGSDFQAVAKARDQVTAWIGEEDRVLEVLRGRLGG